MAQRPDMECIRLLSRVRKVYVTVDAHGKGGTSFESHGAIALKVFAMKWEIVAEIMLILGVLLMR